MTATDSKPNIVLDITGIQGLLPHRYPFLLVDRIVELEPMKRVVGLKNVTINEPFFNGHFPGHPVMPGVLIVEAMAQAGGMMVLDEEKAAQGNLVYFTGLNNVKFRKPVLPGDQLRLEIELTKFRRSMCWMRGLAFVDGALVCEGDLSAALVQEQA